MDQFIQPQILDKLPGNPGAASHKESNYYIIPAAHIKQMPDLIPGTIKYSGDFVLEPGKHFTKLYQTDEKQARNFSTTGDKDASGVQYDISGSFPGTSPEVGAFVQNNLGEGMVVVSRSCDGAMRVYGSKCGSLAMSVEHTDDKDRNEYVFKFANGMMTSQVPHYYYGNIDLGEDPVEIAADATTITVVSGTAKYKTGQNTVATAIASITGGDDSQQIMIVGGGGANASTLPAAAAILLKEGVTWTAYAGSTITLRKFKSGADAFVWIEQSRS